MTRLVQLCALVTSDILVTAFSVPILMNVLRLQRVVPTWIVPTQSVHGHARVNRDSTTQGQESVRISTSVCVPCVTRTQRAPILMDHTRVCVRTASQEMATPVVRVSDI